MRLLLWIINDSVRGMKVITFNNENGKLTFVGDDLRYTPNESSMLKQVARHSDGTMFAYFTSGATYRYKAVPFSALVAIMSSDSAGKAFNEVIKKAGYEYEKVKL